MALHWGPAERLALIEEFARRPGADSSAFFFAHGLGNPYSRPGEGSGRKSRILSALMAAESEDRIDEILDAIATKLEWGSVADGGDRPVSSDSGKVFVSHSSRDESVAGLLVDSLVLAGVPRGRLFYSSHRSSGVPAGEDVRYTLKNSLQGAVLVVELLSSAFFASTYCVLELGAAWALEKSTFPIVLPPFTMGEAKERLGNVQMGILLGSKEIEETLDELSGYVGRQLGLTVSAYDWNRAFRTFTGQLQAALDGRPSAALVQPAGADDSSDLMVAQTSGFLIEKVGSGTSRLGRGVHGEITNLGRIERRVTLEATYYGPTGVVVGTSLDMVSQLGPGETKSFSFASVPEGVRVKVQVKSAR